MFIEGDNKNNYATTKDAKMGNHTSDTISKDTSELSREGSSVECVSSIDTKICKDLPYRYNSSPGAQDKEAAGKCGISTSGHGSTSSNAVVGLSKLWDTSSAGANSGKSNYATTAANKMGNHTSDKISKKMAELGSGKTNRAEKVDVYILHGDTCMIMHLIRTNV